MALQSYRDLRVWQEAMTLAEICYELTRRFPKDELFGLTSQIRRAASSVPANIAEGYGRASRKEYVQFLYIAQGSLKELETHLLLGARVRCCSEDDVTPIIDRTETLGKMLRALIAKLRS
jgi:four helix bundle protein